MKLFNTIIPVYVDRHKIYLFSTVSSHSFTNFLSGYYHFLFVYFINSLINVDFRNNSIRKEGIEDNVRITTSKLESQVFNTRTSLPPSVIQFHPFDQQIAVAGKDHFGYLII